MTKCPVCQFENEDGALFCDQCKSDLANADTVVADRPVTAESTPGGAASLQTIPEGGATLDSGAQPAVAEAVPVAEVADEVHTCETLPPEAVLAEAAALTPTLPVSAVIPPPEKLEPGTKPRLVVLRGQRVNVEYPLYEGDNYIGRADDKAVDIDLEDQEAPDRVWSSRQHALITFQDGMLTVEDLNSLNGTFVNRLRLHPGQKRPLRLNDVIQIGTVQMKVQA